MIWKMAAVAAGLGLSLCVSGTASALSLSSPDVKDHGTVGMEQVFNTFTCTGKNISPALTWKGAPAATKSFAVTVYDPDAPTGSGWWHWVVFNIPPSVTSLPKNAGDMKANLTPAGAIQGRTDFGGPGWGGPCPPKGDKPHHYTFTVYALDIDHIDADANTSAAFIGYNVHFHTLAKAKITATYGRPQ
jgi:Raf kinase inhibitor-like YbhB/YbcL family protein